MEIRKSKKADLEKYLGIFFQTGLIIGLSLILLAFEWTTKPKVNEDFRFISKTTFEIEEVEYTERKETETKSVLQQKLVDIILLVDDNVIVDDPFDFDLEATQDTKFSMNNFIYDNDVPVESEPVIIVEDMPLFNGGDPRVEFRKYISENLEYPSIASENGISGKVIIQFVVNAQGKVTDAVVAASVDPALDKEALRVVLSSPLWTPGKQRGKPVKVLYFFPINFVLSNN